MPPAIDLDHLDQYVCGDRALLDEILTIFEEQARLWLARLDPESDDESWRNAAHALKGASRGVGAWRIGDICEAAEDMIDAGPDKATRRRAVVDELESLIVEAVGEVGRIRSVA